MTRRENSLRTGQVAKMLAVSPGMIRRWFDSGLLVGWRASDSSHRFFTEQAVTEFARRWDIPLQEPNDAQSPGRRT